MIDFNFPVLHSAFEQHADLKTSILDAINNQEENSLEKTETYHCPKCEDRVTAEVGFSCTQKDCLCECYTYNISRVDWNNAKDTERLWVKIFGPPFMNHLDKEMSKVNLMQPQMINIWFQQYTKKGSHGWHTHGNNFTGVYYLELNSCSPRTQLVEPMNLNIKEVDAKEGDIIIFPAMYIHRSPMMKSDKTKTIISFNFDCATIDIETQLKLKELYGF